MKKRVAAIALVVIFGTILYGLVSQIHDALRAGERLDEEAAKLASLQKRSMELKKKLVEVESVRFIERQARDKLNQSRPNEVVVVIPQAEIDRVLGQGLRVVEPPIPSWQGWLRLFFP